MDKALVAAVRALDERAKFCGRLDKDMEKRGKPLSAKEYRRQADELRSQQLLIRDLLLSGRSHA